MLAGADLAPTRTSRLRFSRIVGAAAGALTLFGLTACTPVVGTAELGVERTEVREDLVDTDVVIGTEVAPGLEPTARIALGGVTLAGDDAIIGLAEVDESTAIEMAAVDSSGSARWQVETSPTCTAFALSAADGVEIAVFMDARPAPSDSGQITETVATAFRMSDGEKLWGPAPVPGPLLADAGLVFYSPQDAPIADVSGSAVMLDPFTGEQRISAESSEVEILGEYAGIGLVLAATQTATTAERVSPDEDTLQAISLADGAVLWQEKDLVRPEGVPVSASFEASTAREALLEGVMIGSWVSGADSDRFDAVAYDLESGELLTTFDGALTGNAVASEGRVYVELRVDEGVSVAAVDRDGTQWTATLAAGATAVSVGGGSVYLRLGGTGIVLDASTGAETANGDFRVPEHVFADGSALIKTRDELWLASPRSSLSKEP